jgi:ABC-2 type transport system ATP-binding protein
MLQLRDRGCTVFFSSHVLSDAEALCHEVAILAHGRLVASGRLSDMLEFQARGWELMMANVSDSAAAALGSRVRKAVRIGVDRYAFELPVEPSPDRIIAELTGAGAQLVSLNPIRETLEEFFVKQIATSAADVPRGRLEAVS